MDGPGPSFLVRHEFLIRRLHSLSGLIPVGAYMVVHLATNASVLDDPATFQNNVYTIHSLGAILPLVEWGFIFLPILFHAVIGVVIVAGGLPNQNQYRYAANWRYTLQRWTGMIAFAFIMWHVFHMHGWIHAEPVRERVVELGGAKFAPYNASSSAGLALQSVVVAVLYAIGVLACVYHLANGIWTMGITWGAWTTPAAMRRADRWCIGFGVLVALVGLGAIGGFYDVNVKEAHEVETKIYNSKVSSGVLEPNDHKRAQPHAAPADETAQLKD